MNKGKILARGTKEQILKEAGCNNLENAFLKITGKEEILDE